MVPFQVIGAAIAEKIHSLRTLEIDDTQNVASVDNSGPAESGLDDQGCKDQRFQVGAHGGIPFDSGNYRTLAPTIAARIDTALQQARAVSSADCPQRLVERAARREIRPTAQQGRPL